MRARNERDVGQEGRGKEDGEGGEVCVREGQFSEGGEGGEGCVREGQFPEGGQGGEGGEGCVREGQFHGRSGERVCKRGAEG